MYSCQFPYLYINPSYEACASPSVRTSPCPAENLYQAAGWCRHRCAPRRPPGSRDVISPACRQLQRTHCISSDIQSEDGG